MFLGMRSLTVHIIVVIQLVATTALLETQNCGSAARRSAAKQPWEFTRRTLRLSHTTGSDRYQSGGSRGTPYEKKEWANEMIPDQRAPT